MKDYNEILLTAIDTVVAQRLSELQFDETIICTIVDDNDKKNGHYRVTDGSITFDAYTETTHYYNDAQVYVTIPKGDWTARKLITGRYTGDEDNQPITYVSPLEKVAQLTENLANDFGGADVAANCSYDNSGNPIAGAFIKEIGSIETPINTLINDTLCIQADFKCLLDSYDMESGAYGLMVKAFDGGDKEIATFMLDSSRDMFGRPYAYTAWAAQSQAYKFNSSIGIIKKLVWYLYQDGNFYYDNGTDDTPIAVPVNKISDKEVQSNIFVRNIQIFFGTDVSQVEDNTVKIVTNSSLKYEGKENIDKNIELIWYNKGEENKFLGFKDGKFDKNKAKGERPEGDVNNYYWIEWYADGELGVAKLVQEYNLEKTIEENQILVAQCIPQLASTDVYAIVWLNGAQYKSNTITFTNNTDKTHLVLGTDVKIKIINGDWAQDAYAIYGEDNQAIAGEAYKTRTVKFDWEWNLGKIEKEYWYGAKITWTIPNDNTMISAKNIESETITSENFNNITTFQYKLKSIYVDTARNNTITCIVEHNGFILTTIKSLVFSSQGNSGTDYTLIVRPNDGREFGFKDGKALIQSFNVNLIDPQGKDISLEGDTALGRSYELFPSGLDENNKHLPEYYNTIVATASGSLISWAGQGITLKTIYPVIYSQEDKYYASVPTKIVYDSFGTLKTKIPKLQLFNRDGTVAECSWRISYRNNKNEEITRLNNLNILPQIKDGSLLVPSIYISEAQATYCVLIASHNNEILYTQPVIIQQYKYGSEVLNNWNGALTIDEENNQILSAAAVFGVKKNSNNTFSGVILGDVKNIDATTGYNTGLYGYQNGAQSYGFRDDGTAFIGKSGTGRIEFDGEKGVIQSGGYTAGINGYATEGMEIDLQNGSLRSKNFYINKDGSASFKGDINIADSFKINGQGVNFGEVFEVDRQGNLALYTTKDVAQHTGTCDTSASDPVKVINIDNSSSFPPIIKDMYPTGTVMKVLFKEGNTYAKGIKFRINGTGETGYEDVVTDLFGSVDTSPEFNSTDWYCFRYNQKAGNGNGAWELITEGKRNQVFCVNNNELWFDGNGTFTGTLKAASGTFTGELVAATGTFSGGITANSLTLTDNSTATINGVISNNSLVKSIQSTANSALSTANTANSVATTANSTANTAKSLAEGAKSYTDSAISTLDSKVAKHLSGGKTTVLGSNYVISPYIGGGYLNITSGNKKVIIDPQNLTGNGYIFQVHNGSEITLGIDSSGNTSMKGKVTATTGEIGGWTLGKKTIYSTGGQVIANNRESIYSTKTFYRDADGEYENENDTDVSRLQREKIQQTVIFGQTHLGIELTITSQTRLSSAYGWINKSTSTTKKAVSWASLAGL